MSNSTKKTKMKIKMEQEKTTAPLIEEGLVHVSMLPNDLITLTSLMSICAKMFEEQALVASQQNNKDRYAMYAARHKLSTLFANKFYEFCTLGEPTSRDMH